MNIEDIDMNIVGDILRNEYDISPTRQHIYTIYSTCILIMYTERMDGTGNRLHEIPNELYITYSRNNKIDELL